MSTKLRKNDNVKVIAGKEKGKEGKILKIDRKNKRVIVEGVNMISKHQKPGAGVQGGIVQKESAIHLSNVMFLHKGKPTRLGFKVENTQKDGKTVKIKKRFAKSTGELID